MAKDLELRAEKTVALVIVASAATWSVPRVVPGQRRPDSAALRASNADGDAWCRKELPAAIADAG